MIFGRRRDEEDDEDEIELVYFKGALNGEAPDLNANKRLVAAGLELAKEIVTDALNRRAGILRIDPKGPRASVALMVDGIPQPGDRLTKQEAFAVTQTLKLLSGLDIKERTKPQLGGVRAELENQPYILHVGTQAVADGERLTIRIDDPRIKLEKLEDLGVTQEFKLKLRNLVSTNKLFLVVGPPQTGVTTSLYAVVRALDCYLNQIYSFGDHGDRKLDNITPYQPRPNDDLAQSLLRAHRADANIMVMTPLKEEEVARTILGFGENLHIICEMAAKDAPSAIAQLIKWNGDAPKIAASLSGILTQKLIRTLCKDCKEAYKPAKTFLAKIGLPEDTKVLYRKRQPAEEDEEELDPCESCGDLGYKGRAAMFELLEMTDEMRTLISSNPDPALIKTQMRKDKMLLLQTDALRLVAEGKTSLEEVQRVFRAK